MGEKVNLCILANPLFKASVVEQQTSFQPSHLGRDFLYLTDGLSTFQRSDGSRKIPRTCWTLQTNKFWLFDSFLRNEEEAHTRVYLHIDTPLFGVKPVSFQSPLLDQPFDFIDDFVSSIIPDHMEHEILISFVKKNQVSKVAAIIN